MASGWSSRTRSIPSPKHHTVWIFFARSTHQSATSGGFKTRGDAFWRLLKYVIRPATVPLGRSLRCEMLTESPIRLRSRALISTEMLSSRREPAPRSLRGARNSTTSQEKQGCLSLQKPRVVRGETFRNLDRRATDRHLVGPLVERVSRTSHTSPGFSLEPEG